MAAWQQAEAEPVTRERRCDLWNKYATTLLQSRIVFRSRSSPGLVGLLYTSAGRPLQTDPKTLISARFREWHDVCLINR
jgi:hypothetical protein